MTTVLLSTLLLLMPAQAAVKSSPRPAVSSAVAGVKSYDFWKKEKIQIAYSQLETTRSAIQAYRARNLPIPSQFSLQFNQQLWSLESARELTVNDYFLLYLSRYEQAASFQEGLAKLNPADMKALLQAYARTLNPALPAHGSVTLPRTAETTK